MKADKLKYDRSKTTESCTFVWSDPGEPYLTRLRTEYQLDSIVQNCNGDYDKVKAICTWVHGLWKHNGNNEPSKNDPLTILSEVKQGKQFRCVEYGIVVAGCLNALGVKTRMLALKTEDVETRQSGAGHVAAEAYCRDLEKWVLVDGQFDAIPLLNGTPINAVELQHALAHKAPGLGIYTISNYPLKIYFYFRWIAQYLYYLDVHLDNRVIEQKGPSQQLMLVPLGAKKPTVFQRKWPMKNMAYTHSAALFYATPE